MTAAHIDSAKQRRLALNDAIDLTRRASAAAKASAVTEPSPHRRSILLDAERTLTAVLRELQALT